MGLPQIDHVLPATMIAYPGRTAEELLEILSDVPESLEVSTVYHLSGKLNLEYREGWSAGKPTPAQFPCTWGSKWGVPWYGWIGTRVVTHLPPRTTGRRATGIFTHEEAAIPGMADRADILSEVPFPHFLTRSVGWQKKIREHGVEFYRFVGTVEEIKCEIVEETFESVEELVEKYPQFEARKAFNFEQERGEFLWSIPPLYWIQKDGRYFFDPENYRTMPKVGEWGYTSFMMAAEAVKQGYWDIFRNYLHTRNRDRAIKRFPSVKEAYERAVWDAFTSEMARGKTLTELLRLRAELRVK